MNCGFNRGHALVTGAIGGLGTAIVKRLIEAGIPVIGTYAFIRIVKID